MNYLVVVAHPDDEVLGAGATIHKLIKEGHKVAVATMANHAAARANISDTLSEDQDNAMKILGVRKVYAADFPNIKMNIVPHLELVQFIEKCIEDFNAEAFITHHPSDTNIDHVMTAGAVQAAVRLFQRKEGIPALKELLYMEVPSSTEWSIDCSANKFTPNYFVEIGKEGVDVKIKALSAYFKRRKQRDIDFGCDLCTCKYSLSTGYMKNIVKNERESNFELLRILSMFFIVMHHYSIHGVMNSTIENEAYLLWSQGSNINKIISCMCIPGGGIGVGCFL